MSFHVVAALLLGILLPLLETVRRGWDHWAVNFTTMFEDYAAGVALLVAAVAVLRRQTWARSWMLISWSGISFMMLISTVSQVERNARGDLEPHAGWVLAIKLLLLFACAVALAQSVRQSKVPQP
jgi:hypothetical protein